MSVQSGASGDSEGPTGDPVDDALAEALKKATEAGRWDVVAQLARDLSERSAARWANVIPIGRRLITK